MRGGELQLNKYGAGVYSYVWAGLVKDGVPCMIFTASTDHCLLYILIKVAINNPGWIQLVVRENHLLEM